MTRQELINKINPCGGIDYLTALYLINNVQVSDESTRLTLIERLPQNGKLKKEDFKTLARIVVYRNGSPINSDTISGWLSNKSCLTTGELITFIDNINFTDGSLPTFLLAENGQILISE